MGGPIGFPFGPFLERFGEGSPGAFLDRFTDSLGSPESGGSRHSGSRHDTLLSATITPTLGSGGTDGPRLWGRGGDGGNGGMGWGWGMGIVSFLFCKGGWAGAVGTLTTPR